MTRYDASIMDMGHGDLSTQEIVGGSPAFLEVLRQLETGNTGNAETGATGPEIPGRCFTSGLQLRRGVSSERSLAPQEGPLEEDLNPQDIGDPHMHVLRSTPIEDRLRRIIDTIPALVLTASHDGAVEFINRRWLEYTGLNPEALLGWGWRVVIHPDDVGRFVDEWRVAMAAGKPFENEARVRGADGNYRWFRIRKTPLLGEQGDVLQWYGTGHDIEELRRAQSYLARAERLAHSGTWALNTSGGFDYWSRELFEIHGRDPAVGAPTGAEYLALVHPEDRAFMAGTIERMLAEASGIDVTKRIIRPDGEVRYIRYVGTPVVENGGLKGFVGSAIDVTEHEHLTQELRRREAELQQVLDLTPQQITVIGPDWSRIYANQTALDYFGLSLEEWRSQEPLGLLHPDDLERVITEVQAMFSRGTRHETEARLRRCDGTYRWFLLHLNPLRDEHDSITRWYVSGADIEDRKQNEERLRHENVALREEIDKASMFEEIVGTSRPLRGVLARVSKVAPTDSTVLITGETGTGKELIARAVHKQSTRSSRAFVSVNCAAIPPALIGSELFGHEKGAFTGALQRHVGRFELAEGGTIFLDEIGDLPPETQIALLRVLQEKEIQRVGGNQSIPINVRVIAATNRDLQGAIESRAFRSDLFYRLNVFPIEIPSLRERRDDIPLLVEYFIHRYARQIGKRIDSIDTKSLDLLRSYPWPGNIRELQNVIERSVIVCDTEVFSVDESWLSRGGRTGAVPAEKQELSKRPAHEEREIIEAALAESRGRVSGPSGAAGKLGIPSTTLESKIRTLRIDKHRFKSL